jgi:hypothetical protein
MKEVAPMSDLTAQEAVRAEQEAAAEAALSRLGLEAKVATLSGQYTWTLPALPEIGLASIVMSDALQVEHIDRAHKVAALGVGALFALVFNPIGGAAPHPR